MARMNIFKKCSLCATVWETRDNFVDDPSLDIIGYTADFNNLEDSFFYFVHTKKDCLTSLVIKARNFLDLYKGERYSENKAGSEDCPGLCLIKDQLDRCDALCECAFNREVIQIIKNRKS